MAPAELTTDAPLAFGTRLWFAWVCFFRVLFDGAFARRAFDVRDGMPEPARLPAAKVGERPSAAGPTADGPDGGTRAGKDGEGEEGDAPPRAGLEAPRPGVEAARPDLESRRRMAHTVREPRPDPTALSAARESGALALLALLQREGRLVDFLQQDVASFPDEEIGAAARVVHAGCRKALVDHATIAQVLSDEEGATVQVAEGYEPASVKLVGDVKGAPPFSGKLRHRGWRASQLRLPEPVAGHDVRVLAPAEVEL